VTVDSGIVSGIQNKVWNVWLGPEPICSTTTRPQQQQLLAIALKYKFHSGRQDGDSCTKIRNRRTKKLTLAENLAQNAKMIDFLTKFQPPVFIFFRNFCFNYEFYSGHIFE
jgi:hypothetical protein